MIALEKFREHVAAGQPIDTPDLREVMMVVGDRNRRLTARLNSEPLEPKEIRALMSEVISQELDEGFRLFPPFTTDFPCLPLEL